MITLVYQLWDFLACLCVSTYRSQRNAQCSKRAEINVRLHKCVYNLNSLQVRHLPNNQTFNEGNLEVSTELHGKTVTWRPTPAATTTLDGNLLGTIRVRPLLYEITPYSDCLNELHYTTHATEFGQSWWIYRTKLLEATSSRSPLSARVRSGAHKNGLLE